MSGFGTPFLVLRSVLSTGLGIAFIGPVQTSGRSWFRNISNTPTLARTVFGPTWVLGRRSGALRHIANAHANTPRTSSRWSLRHAGSAWSPKTRW